MILDSIPKTLRELPRWIWWDKDKKPRSAVTGKQCDPTNLANGVSYEEAVDYIMLELNAGGLGFLLGDGIAGVDIDGAYDDSGLLKKDASDIIDMLKPCYVERSPSGKGVHIVGFGAKNTSLCKKPLNRSKLLEVYDKERYFTVTGNKLPESEPDLTDLTSRLTTLCDTFLPEPIRGKAVAAGTEDTWTDEEVIGALQVSPTHSFIFHDLWNGDLSRYNGDASSADAALVERLLFFSGGNEEQVDRLFRQSQLMRDKWDEMRGKQTYGQLTIVRIKQQMTVFRSKQRPLTEVGAAERMADHYGDSITYCHDWGKWLIWDETRWDIDRTNQIQSMAVQMIRSIPREAKAMDEETQKAYVKFSRGLEKNTAVGNVLRQAERMVPVLSSNLDSNLWLLNCLNGTLNLTNGKLYPHNSKDLNTKRVPIIYDPKAKCPRFDEFLQTVLCGNEELIEFILQYMGITLTGSIREQCFVVLYGQGDNGKSVLLNIIRALMGDYGKAAPPNVFLEKKHGDGIPNDLADLQGARFVVDIETKERIHFNEQRIKAVTGGEPVKARFLNKEFFEYVPQMKLWIASNHRPTISGMDKGIWRRIRLVPFDAVISDSKKIKDLDKIIIHGELPGILQKAIQGALSWQKAGKLVSPEIVRLTTAEYQKDMDIMGQFIEECCEVGTDNTVMKDELYQSYRSWAISAGQKFPLTSVMFGIKMKERNLFGERKHRGLNGRYSWEGIKLKVTDDFLQ